MTIRLLAGDCRDVLATLPDASVHCVVTSPPYYALRSYLDAGHVDKHREIGSESTPDEYLATMVQVFREVRRVLRPDGTVWCNLGDSYVGGGGYWADAPSNANGSKQSTNGGSIATSERKTGLAAKQLLLMPARLALALQADGWWVRSDIIWHKPNPMPESVNDRPVSSYEHVFLLSKSARYFFDSDAIREPHTGPSVEHFGVRSTPADRGCDPSVVRTEFATGAKREYNPAGRSCRNVWTIATHAYSAAHFATFPPELAERCVKAGTSARGCCAQCGAPWRREQTKEFVPQPDVSLERGVMGGDGHKARADGWAGVQRGSYARTTIGWSPSCTHGGDPVPCTVLDPFAGAGTTLLVADRLQRDAIGIELNPNYTRMAMDRCQDDAPLFAAFPVTDPADERMADLFAPLAAD